MPLNNTGVLILTASRSSQSRTLRRFPFNPPLKGGFDIGQMAGPSDVPA